MDLLKNINSGIAIKTIQNLFAVTLLLLVINACSKDDGDMMIPIELKTQTFEIKSLNDCNTSTGKGSTTFMYIPYTAPAGTIIKKLHRISRVSNGESSNDVTTVFQDKNNIIEWASCIRFGSQSWMEFEVRMEDSNGTLSNASIVRIDKPTGAN